ncbi:MAG: hypothetical protein KJP25_02090 [Gammaproteobacteria bacterium]|nr:hypothetical protein [Gammaproteobacteria bacterium]MBT8151014.1 hypothetical protein [Gammaproteobacteria bacterium]NNL11860.1 hypothetical protein [Pseudomonadales bacterium]NNM11787.1 hypothetical protein [Pseudomonadales bacterium]RZV55478.1 MAG: hypothetical protein EX270_06435 [Pseudomonadales bacterium]
MSHWLLVILLALVFCALAALGWRLAKAEGWLMGWLHGCAVMITIFFAVLFLALTYTVSRLDTVAGDRALAMVSVKTAEANSFFLEIGESSDEAWYTSLAGDGWQLQVHGVRFDGVLGTVLHNPAVRLHTVSNRFYDFAQRSEARSVRVAPGPVDSFFSAIDVDIWWLLERIFGMLKPVGIVYEKLDSEVIPLVNDGLYSVHWRRTHIEITPANEAARLGMLPEPEADSGLPVGAAGMAPQTP